MSLFHNIFVFSKKKKIKIENFDFFDISYQSTTLKRNTLLDACINNNGNIFDVIKKQRQTTPSVPDIIDGISVDTEAHFA